MGLPAPSQADASRRLRAVEIAPRVDERAPPALGAAIPPLDEPVSPELALVDPDLAARLRARLPEIELEPPDPPEPVVPVEEATVHPLRPPLVVVDGDVGAESAVAVVGSAAASAVPPSVGRSDLKRLVAAFVAGAALAAVVTTGVIAEMGESDMFSADPGTVPPITKPVAPAVTKSQSTKPRKVPAKPKIAASKKPQATARPPAKPQRPAQAKTTPSSPKKPAAPAAEPRRFAWAPVAGAVGYRVELFRGNEQILQVTTKTPAYALPPTWRNGGHTERLTPGDYRWYVWPVLPDGPAGAAVVQAKLSVP